MKDVHTEHCCSKHGCKYGKDDICTVVTGKAPQSFPCEDCTQDVTLELTPSEVSDLLGALADRRLFLSTLEATPALKTLDQRLEKLSLKIKGSL